MIAETSGVLFSIDNNGTISTLIGIHATSNCLLSGVFRGLAQFTFLRMISGRRTSIVRFQHEPGRVDACDPR
jgi:hypothetical protein